MIKRIRETTELLNRLATLKNDDRCFSKQLNRVGQKIVSALFNGTKRARNEFE